MRNRTSFIRVLCSEFLKNALLWTRFPIISGLTFHQRKYKDFKSGAMFVNAMVYKLKVHTAVSSSIILIQITKTYTMYILKTGANGVHIIYFYTLDRILGSISVSGQLPTYPSPNPTCCQLTVVELGEG